MKTLLKMIAMTIMAVTITYCLQSCDNGPKQKFRARHLCSIGEHPNNLQIVDVPFGYKSGDTVLIDDFNHGYAGLSILLEPVTEAGDIITYPHWDTSDKFFANQILFPDLYHNDTLIVTNPQLLERIVKQSQSREDIIHGIYQCTKPF